MQPFLITARTDATCLTFSALARSSAEAAMLSAELLGGQPCGITVTPLKVRQ
jgi:hypothetical protein